MIEVQNVSKSYSNRLVVNNISFTVGKGEILGFLGPNGAGKTTTMRMLTGYFTPTYGTIKVAGFDVIENPELAKSKIGYLPENPPLYQDMKTRDYLEFVAKLKGVEKVADEVEYVSKLCGIDNVLDRLIANLSKGYKQRIGIAQALLNDPEVLILDEPTVGLDPKQIIEIRNLIKSLAGTRTIILSSHILPEITMTCTRVAIINEGKIVAVDTTDSLANKLSNKKNYKLTLKKIDDKFIDIIKAFDEVVSVDKKDQHINITTKPDTELAPAIIQKLVENKAEILEFRKEEVSLEDIFLKLTTKEAL